MNVKGNYKPSKEWKDMSKKEKREVIAVLATFCMFILFWISSGFLSALGMILVLWSFYFIFRTVKVKGLRKQSAVIAIVLFFLGGFILPDQSVQPPVASVSTEEVSESDRTEITKAEEAKKEAERIAREKEQAEQQKKLEQQKERSAQQINQNGDLYQVTGVTDGDTIKVSINGVIETIRFIGMDTPETKDPRKPVQCFGREASSKMQSYAQSRKVRLEADGSQGDRDKYGRLLRYVFTEDGSNVAYEMIKGGYAHEYTYNLPYKYQSQFKAAQKHARENSKGLWSANTCNGDTDQQYAPSPQSTPTASAYYQNCTAAREAGAAPVYQGQPGYGTHLDRDGDGVGCE